MTAIVGLSSLVALILCGTYYFAYRTHENRFFLAMSIAWFFQASSTSLAGLSQSVSYYSFDLNIEPALEVLTSVCFIVSLKMLRSKALKILDLIDFAFLCVISIISHILWSLPPFWFPNAVSGICAISVAHVLWRLEDNSLLHLVSPERRYEWQQCVGSNLVDYCTLKDAIDLKLHRLIRIAKVILSLSLLGYGILLLIYPALLVMRQPNQVLGSGVFVAAILLKLTHAGGLYLLLLAGFGSVVKAMESKNAFEEIGAIAAGIEHDVRGALSSLFRETKILMHQNSADQKIVEQAQWMERKLRKIRGTLEIIYVLRNRPVHYQEGMKPENLARMTDLAIEMLLTEVVFNKLVRVERQYHDAGITAKVARERIIRALVNILVNAIEAAQARTDNEAPRVVVRIQNRNGTAEISVKDNGAGISEKNAWPLVTRPGFTTKHGGNRGMGLFVASRLIKFHGGDISMSSDGISFTEVIVRLPIWNLNDKAC